MEINTVTPEKEKRKKDIEILDIINLKIKKYANKSIRISDFIYDLESCINQLITIDEQWKKKFKLAWLDVEIAYSLALDQGLEDLTEQGNLIVENSLLVMQKMTEEKTKELKQIVI